MFPVPPKAWRSDRSSFSYSVSYWVGRSSYSRVSALPHSSFRAFPQSFPHKRCVYLGCWYTFTAKPCGKACVYFGQCLDRKSVLRLDVSSSWRTSGHMTNPLGWLWRPRSLLMPQLLSEKMSHRCHTACRFHQSSIWCQCAVILDFPRISSKLDS